MLTQIETDAYHAQIHAAHELGDIANTLARLLEQVAMQNKLLMQLLNSFVPPNVVDDSND